jgi:prefoldin subunit 5
MSEKLRQIQHEIADLRKDLEKLRRLKLDSEQTKKLRRKLVLIGCD